MCVCSFFSATKGPYSEADRLYKYKYVLTKFTTTIAKTTNKVTATTIIAHKNKCEGENNATRQCIVDKQTQIH